MAPEDEDWANLWAVMERLANDPRAKESRPELLRGAVADATADLRRGALGRVSWTFELAGYALCVPPYQETHDDDRFHENEGPAYYVVTQGKARYEAVRTDPSLMPTKSDVPRGTYLLSFLGYIDDVSLERFGDRIPPIPRACWNAFLGLDGAS